MTEEEIEIFDLRGLPHAFFSAKAGAAGQIYTWGTPLPVGAMAVVQVRRSGAVYIVTESRPNPLDAECFIADVEMAPVDRAWRALAILARQRAK